MQPIIQVDELTIAFQNKKILDKLSMSIEKDKIYGLIGKNGSGKSTLLNAILGTYVTAKKHITIQGQNLGKDESPLHNICIVRDYINFTDDLKGKHILTYYHYLYPNYDRKLEKRLVEFFDLPLNKRITKYSKGMQTLLMNIVGLCCKTDIVIYDEPTLGLDAVNRNHFYDILLQEYMRHPQTIILATHQIDEVENILEEVLILKDGKIKIQDCLEAFKAKAWQIVGSKAQLESLEGVELLRQSQLFAESYKALVYDTVDLPMLEKWEQQKLSCELLGLQEFFIELTKGECFEYGDH